MSDPLRIIHGRFGRAVLVRLDHSMVLHAHRECHIVFKIGGADIQFGVGAQEYPVTAQSALLINAWEPHYYNYRGTEAKTVLLAFYLNAHWLKEVDRRFAGSTHPKFFERPVEVLSPRLARGRDDVLDALGQLEPPNVQDMESLIASIFSEIVSLSPPRTLLQFASERVERDYDARIRKTIERMLGNGDLLCGPEDMASSAGLSRAQFFRLFKKSTGLPPTLFLSMLKMEASLQKVAQRDISLQDIAYDLGFDTAGNFTRFFVGVQGFAPSKYRKLLEVV
ncbi:HTH-type transcriptional activator Btr [Xylophilus ampelinus]|nr:HTH-type transcriptional activator Btr [Xylophilus ampelinus]